MDGVRAIDVARNGPTDGRDRRQIVRCEIARDLAVLPCSRTQIGGFLGAYLGGIAAYANGRLQLDGYADMALALAAALINLPIRELRTSSPAASS
jgi:hypothetical protein